MAGRTIVEVESETDSRAGRTVTTKSTPGQGTRETKREASSSTVTETTPEVVSQSEEVSPEIVQTSSRPIHAGIAFSLVIRLHSKEPTPVAD